MSKTKHEAGIEVKVRPDYELKTKRIYANFVEVAQTPYDFSLRFCDAQPIYDIDALNKVGHHNIPVVTEVAIPVALIPGLIKALQSQLKKGGS